MLSTNLRTFAQNQDEWGNSDHMTHHARQKSTQTVILPVDLSVEPMRKGAMNPLPCAAGLADSFALGKRGSRYGADVLGLVSGDPATAAAARGMASARW